MLFRTLYFGNKQCYSIRWSAWNLAGTSVAVLPSNAIYEQFGRYSVLRDDQIVPASPFNDSGYESSAQNRCGNGEPAGIERNICWRR